MSHVIKELRSALLGLLAENEKQAAEIAGLKELLEKKEKAKETGVKKPRKCHDHDR